MQKGTKTIENLSQKKKVELLLSIIDDCILYARDSYSVFARPVISRIVKSKLVAYGYAKEEEE